MAWFDYKAKTNDETAANSKISVKEFFTILDVAITALPEKFEELQVCIWWQLKCSQ